MIHANETLILAWWLGGSQSERLDWSSRADEASSSAGEGKDTDCTPRSATWPGSGSDRVRRRRPRDGFATSFIVLLPRWRRYGRRNVMVAVVDAFMDGLNCRFQNDVSMSVVFDRVPYYKRSGFILLPKRTRKTTACWCVEHGGPPPALPAVHRGYAQPQLGRRWK